MIYVFKNLETGEVREYNLTYIEMKDMEKDTENFERIMCVPNINTTNSDTYVQGHLPASRKKAIELEKDIVNTEADMFNLPHDKRAEHKQKIRDLKATRKAPVGDNYQKDRKPRGK